MLKDNMEFNEKVKPNSSFLNELKEKLPNFFTTNKFDNEGNIIEEGKFDLEKFQKMLQEQNAEEISNGYQLDFIGKNYAKKQAGEFAKSVIVPDNEHNRHEKNTNSQNLFFTGDNLEVLRHLQNNYNQSIDMIYIDPPYNTGSDGFVYPDRFEYSDQALKDMFGMNDTEMKRLKSIQGKATHSAWLTFMYPRLWIAKRLLSSHGVIMISIDDNEMANLKLLCDEVFGEGNGLGEIVRNTNSSKNQSLFLSTSHDYCLVYAKDLTALTEKHKDEKWSVPKNNIKTYIDKVEFLKKQGLPNEEITNELKQLTKYPRFIDFENYWYIDKRGLYRKGDLGGVKNGNMTPLSNPLTGKSDSVPPGGYRYNADKLKDLIEDDRIHFHTDGSLPTVKRYLSENMNQRPKAIMSDDQRPDFKFLSDMNTPFDNPKQLAFMKRIVSIADKDSIILDFFAGSATTAHAVMELNSEDGGNRQFIMVQIPEKTYYVNEKGLKVPYKASEDAFGAGFMSIDEISRERIKRASQKLQEETGITLSKSLDDGFKHYYVVTPEQQTLDDIESFDLESGLFQDNSGQLVNLLESGFDDMIQPFSSEGLQVNGNATGVDTIVRTWLVTDGYKMDVKVENLDLNGYETTYIDDSRLYLINPKWNAKHTKALLNLIGLNQLNVQTIVLYGYSFNLESIRELEIGLNQLDSKVNLLKRY